MTYFANVASFGANYASAALRTLVSHVSVLANCASIESLEIILKIQNRKLKQKIQLIYSELQISGIN